MNINNHFMTNQLFNKFALVNWISFSNARPPYIKTGIVIRIVYRFISPKFSCLDTTKNDKKMTEKNIAAKSPFSDFMNCNKLNSFERSNTKIVTDKAIKYTISPLSIIEKRTGIGSKPK